jgi:hypothetical protein
LRRGRRIAAGSAAALALAACGCGGGRSTGAPPAEAPIVSNRYAGGHVCAECHRAEADAWRGSHHDLAMQPAGSATVLGDFRGASLTHFGVTTRFERKGERFVVTTDGPDGKSHEYDVAYTFGVSPLQQYLIRFPGGRIQALSVCWDARPKSEGGQRWFHLYPDEAVPHDDILHWTGIYQNWNFMCAECHSTNVRKGYDPAQDIFDTTFSEIDVSCEACHGPGADHVEWARAKEEGEPRLAVQFAEPRRASWRIDPATGIAKRDRPRTSHVEFETCGRCHARRGTIREESARGQPLADTHRVALLDGDLYYADGQIREEDYEYGSFAQSKMYAAGVTCSDCHDPHTGKTAAGDATCLKCHQASRFSAAEHHHHDPATEAARCATCHMPTTTYMVVHARHDHGFKVPRPDLTAKTGAPSVCARCHAGAAPAWPGTKRQGTPDWSETIAAGRSDPEAAAGALAALVADRGSPGIVRASAALLAASALPKTAEALAAALTDSDPLVRDAAVRALSGAPAEVRAQLVAPLTADPVRLVRIDAGRALAGPAARGLEPPAAKRAADALEEWRASQERDADRPDARSNLCALHLALGEILEAEAECRAAVRIAPRIPTVYAGLSEVQRVAGREAEAEATLRRGLAVAPKSALLWHAFGLSLVRQHRRAEALAALDRAAALEPGNRRYVDVDRIARQELAGARPGS